MGEDKIETFSKRYFYWAPRVAAAALIIVLVAYVLPRFGMPVGENADWGTFGDYFGGTLNPIFGLLTFVGLLVTIWLQQETLKLQREELRASTEELARSAEALQIQNKTMLAQNFEGTFFRMIERQSELLTNIKSGEKTGIGVINEILRRIRSKYVSGSNYVPTYINYYDTLNSTLGPYFRNLYHTLKLIDENSHLTEEEKIKYANLARAQFSSTEISLIFYNCLSGHGKGLYPYILKYRFLKHIDGTMLHDPTAIQNASIYPLDVYKAR